MDDQERMKKRILELEFERDELKGDIEKICVQNSSSTIDVMARIQARKCNSLEKELSSSKQKIIVLEKECEKLNSEIKEMMRSKKEITEVWKKECEKSIQYENDKNFYQDQVSKILFQREELFFQVHALNDENEKMKKSCHELSEKIVVLEEDKKNLLKEKDDDFKKNERDSHSLIQERMDNAKMNEESNKLRTLFIELHKKKFPELKKISQTQKTFFSETKKTFLEEQIFLESFCEEVLKKLKTFFEIFFEKNENFIENMKDDFVRKKERCEKEMKELKMMLLNKKNENCFFDRNETEKELENYQTSLFDLNEKNSEFFTQVMNEKVSALLLLSQQEERLNFEMQTKNKLENENMNLKKQLKQIIDEKVKLLVDLSDLKESNLTFQEQVKYFQEKYEPQNKYLSLRKLPSNFVPSSFFFKQNSKNENKNKQNENEEIARLNLQSISSAENLKSMKQIIKTFFEIRKSLEKTLGSFHLAEFPSGQIENRTEIADENKKVLDQIGKRIGALKTAFGNPDGKWAHDSQKDKTKETDVKEQLEHSFSSDPNDLTSFLAFEFSEYASLILKLENALFPYVE